MESGRLCSSPLINRRELLRRMGGGFGLVGLRSLVSSQQLRAGPESKASIVEPLAAKMPHFPARAEHVIFLFMNGGMSHVDTFDPKPLLEKYHGQPFPGGELKTERKTGNLMKSPFPFRKYGKSGIEVSDLFPRVGGCIDDICVIRSVYTDIPNHPPGMYMMNCGNIQPGRPSFGSWVTYGLGTENRNLPGFIVLCPSAQPPTGGTPLWHSGFLPPIHQGTYIPNDASNANELIADIHNKRLNLEEQREQLDLLSKLNGLRTESKEHADAEFDSIIQSMEIAFRMQTEAPDVLNISKENPATRQRYGEGDFAKGCLMALRLVERGVRVVQVYFGSIQPWDHHNDIMRHQKLAPLADRPIAALLQDLKERGLLSKTLVIFGSEFGRTPVVETNSESPLQFGRDHNHYGFTVWMAGGGIKGGMTYGNTDDFGFKAAENPVHVHDLHATALHLLGLDHEKLTYRYSGRDFRLTDVHGRVINEIIA
jgi:hypothetical protein